VADPILEADRERLISVLVAAGGSAKRAAWWLDMTEHALLVRLREAGVDDDMVRAAAAKPRAGKLRKSGT
jgi:transcriptional regulator with GAF, ATPase, and Fis domain